MDSMVARPDAPLPIPDGSTASTKEQVSKIEKYTKDMNQYSQEQAIVFQQIASMIPDVERVTLYVVDNTRILGNAIVVKHSL